MEEKNSVTTEPVVTTDPVTPVVVSQAGQSKVGMYAIIGVLLAVAVGVGIFFVTQLANKNAITVAEDTIKSNVVNTVNVLDFNKVTPESPLAFIDREQLKTQLSSFDNLGGMPADYNPAGKTEHIAFNLDASIPVRDYTATRAADAMSTNKIMLKGDLYSKYPADFDVKKYGYSSLSNISDLYANLSVEDLMNSFESLYLDAEFDIDTKENKLAGKMELTMMGFDTYVKFSNLSGDVTDELKSIENQVVRVDLTKHMENLFSAMLKTIATNPSMNVYSAFDPASIDQMLDMMEAQIKASGETLPADQVATMKRLGNPIKNAIVKAIQGLDLFVNEKEATAIREAVGVTCTSGDLNIAGMIEQGKNAAVEIVDILKSDESFRNNPEIPSGSELNAGFSMYSEMIMESLPTVTVRLCNDGARTLRGFGIDFISTADGMSVKFDLLTASLDSNKEITKPNADMDVTPQVDAAFEQIDFDMLFNMPITGGYGYGTMMLPEGFEGTELNMEDPSSLEGLPTDYLTELDPAMNDYLKEMEEIANRYSNNEITMEEYLAQLEALSAKYQETFDY